MNVGYGLYMGPCPMDLTDDLWNLCCGAASQCKRLTALGASDGGSE